MTDRLLHRGLTEKIIGVFIRLTELGPGFLESVYSNGMGIALPDAGLEVAREVPVWVHFRGRRIGRFRADTIVESKVRLEFKAGDRLDPNCEAQVINYLRATKIEVEMILHFGQKPHFKRLIETNDRKLIP